VNRLKLKQIDFLKTGLVILSFVMTIAPVTVFGAGLPAPDCNSNFSGLNCNSTGPNDLIKNVINILLAVAFLIAVLFLIIGGFRYIMSAGNAEAAEAGRNTIINALIGIVVIILAYVIVRVVSNAVGNAGGTGSSAGI
jgi:heme/copper-type cytochrome/quinol oxidase subunit 2